MRPSLRQRPGKELDGERAEIATERDSRRGRFRTVRSVRSTGPVGAPPAVASRDSEQRRASAEMHRRSIAKAITYRLLGTAVTAGTAWLLTSQWQMALGMGLLDLGGKVGIYYLHERIWEHVSFGRARSAG